MELSEMELVNLKFSLLTCPSFCCSIAPFKWSLRRELQNESQVKGALRHFRKQLNRWRWTDQFPCWHKLAPGKRPPKYFHQIIALFGSKRPRRVGDYQRTTLGRRLFSANEGGEVACVRARRTCWNTYVVSWERISLAIPGRISTLRCASSSTFEIAGLTRRFPFRRLEMKHSWRFRY